MPASSLVLPTIVGMMPLIVESVSGLALVRTVDIGVAIIISIS